MMSNVFFLLCDSSKQSKNVYMCMKVSILTIKTVGLVFDLFIFITITWLS